MSPSVNNTISFFIHHPLILCHLLHPSHILATSNTLISISHQLPFSTITPRKPPGPVGILLIWVPGPGIHLRRVKAAVKCDALRKHFRIILCCYRCIFCTFFVMCLYFFMCRIYRRNRCCFRYRLVSSLTAGHKQADKPERYKSFFHVITSRITRAQMTSISFPEKLVFRYLLPPAFHILPPAFHILFLKPVVPSGHRSLPET